MFRDELSSYLSLLDIENYYFYDSDTRVAVNCPLAYWFHKSRSDYKPSGVFFNEEQVTYHCFACKTHETLSGLLESYATLNKKPNLLEVAQKLRVEQKVTNATRCLSLANSYSRRFKLPQQVSSSVAKDEYYFVPISGNAAKYIEHRGIPETTSQLAQLRFDVFEKRILFPVFDQLNHFHGMVGRTIIDEQPKYKNYKGLNTARVLGGENLLPRKPHSIILVEGFFDLLKCYQWARDANMGIVSTFKADLSQAQLSKLLAFDANLIVSYDNDDAGNQGYEKIKFQTRKEFLNLKRIYHETKDLGELSQQEFQQLFLSKKEA